MTDNTAPIQRDCIVAPATPNGVGAIAVIRLSGKDSFSILQKIFKGAILNEVSSHTIHYGHINDGPTRIDEVVVSVFKAPKSYTKEDIAEISTHGSPFIVKKVIELLIQSGARLAHAGEFTQRAFLNGRFDLAQAEAVADLISSENEASHRAAIAQMRGGFSAEIKALRDKLVHFASLLELELDFSEEDVEFADREQLTALVSDILKAVLNLKATFQYGNALKDGIPVVIAGKPNAGKSTLLNALLQEEKAIVSEIAGTTRDVIEDEMIIEGVPFRFVDTAGLRDALDSIEVIGVQRTRERMGKASLIMYIFDSASSEPELLKEEIADIEKLNIPFMLIGNKTDLISVKDQKSFQQSVDTAITFISAENQTELQELKAQLLERVHGKAFTTGNTLVSNLRHFESLQATENSLEDVLNGITRDISNDFIALDIRQALHHLGLITGEITTDDLLENIFSKFCIGK